MLSFLSKVSEWKFPYDQIWQPPIWIAGQMILRSLLENKNHIMVRLVREMRGGSMTDIVLYEDYFV